MSVRIERRACADGHARVEFEVQAPVDGRVDLHGADAIECPVCLIRQRLQNNDVELSNLRFRLDQVEQEVRQHQLWHQHAAPVIDPMIDEHYAAEDAREVLSKPVLGVAAEAEEDIPF